MKYGDPKEMGKRVEIVHSYHRVLGEHSMRSWAVDEFHAGRVGWIAGFRMLQEGNVVYGGYDEPTYWSGGGKFPAVLVCLWPTSKPIPCPLDGVIETVGKPLSPSAHEMATCNPELKRRFRETMRQEMKD